MASRTRGTAKVGRGYFAVGIWQPKREVNVGGLLRSAFLFDAALVFTIGARYSRQASDTTDVQSHVPTLHCADLDDLIQHLPNGCSLVGVEMDAAATLLANYVHPARAVYLLGAELTGLPAEVLKRCNEVVQIESAKAYSMNVACAGGIVLHDRYVKALGGSRD